MSADGLYQLSIYFEWGARSSLCMGTGFTFSDTLLIYVSRWMDVASTAYEVNNLNG